MRKNSSFLSLIILVMVGFSFMSLNASDNGEFRKKVKMTPTRTNTVTPTLTRTPTNTPTLTNTPTETLVPIDTPTDTVSVTDTPTPIVSDISPYPSAPLCPDSSADHDYSNFHTLWDSARGCHYDHEHGTNPFISDVDVVFSGIQDFLGGTQIGSTNESSSVENVLKHGGMKWQVDLNPPNGAALGFQGATVAICAYVTEYHAFGNYAIEFNNRIHSAVAMIQQCKSENMDYGYLYVVQHLDYGQRTFGYQGDIAPYFDTPNPSYPAGFAPYFTADCIGRPSPPCGEYVTREEKLAHNQNATTTWTSESPQRVGGSSLLQILFRARDTYQIFDWSKIDVDGLVPSESFLWMCSNDGGETFTNVVGCRYNNSTTRVHEIQGIIPAGWDNLVGFDTDNRVGRITADGFVTRFGQLVLSCTTAGGPCFPIKMISAYVGQYGSLLYPNKSPAFVVPQLPERDIYFCGGVVCDDASPNATPSGWIGPNN